MKIELAATILMFTISIQSAGAQTALPPTLRGFELGATCEGLEGAVKASTAEGLRLATSSTGEKPCERSKQSGRINGPGMARMLSGRYKEAIFTEFNELGRLSRITVDTLWSSADMQNSSAIIVKLFDEYGTPAATTLSTSTGAGFFDSVPISTVTARFLWSSKILPPGSASGRISDAAFDALCIAIAETIFIAEVSEATRQGDRTIGLKLSLENSRIAKEVDPPKIRVK